MQEAAGPNGFAALRLRRDVSDGLRPYSGGKHFCIAQGATGDPELPDSLLVIT